MTEEPPKHHVTKVDKCPECKSDNLVHDYDTGEEVCGDCGLVLYEQMMDSGPHTRAFTEEEKRKRDQHGAPETYSIHDKGLSTFIDWHDRDIYGKGFTPEQKSQAYRLRKWHRRTRIRDSSERSLSVGLAEIKKTAGNLNLPKNILDTASVIYRKAVKEGLIRGRFIQGIAAAAIYLSSRQCGSPRTLKEIADSSFIKKKELGRCYRFLIKEFDYYVPPQKPGQYVTKLSSQLGYKRNVDDITQKILSAKVEEITHKILSAARELKLTSGRGPTGIAAAAGYIASVLTGEKKTQREIAEIYQVTEVTIRNRYKELMDRLYFITFH